MIDLRSDTVTKPTEKMRAAIAAAEVGDDVYGEDPTINRLEKRSAEIFGKEAGLFVPTGTMGNTIAIKIHTNHGEEVACEARSHIVDWELSMMAWFSGCIPRTISGNRGILSWPQIETVLRPKGPHNAPTTLVALENTHNMGGGTVYPLDSLDEICMEAHRRGLKVHMDGARIFNASVALGVPVSRIARDADTVMFCLSKGLGAPVGSLLVGDEEAIARGRMYRKRLGGGMRQAGVLAAAGLIALEESPALLEKDHRNARELAKELAAIPGIEIDPADVQTNILIFDISDLGVATSVFSRELKNRGVLANGINARQMRMVTHSDVSREDCRRAAEIAGEVAAVVGTGRAVALH
ncbi:MAG: aminotransferase class I/II-fold pyridoxal phosphate-dependent enzyme [Acidobacteriaceae bacterium]|nr:aminotransferase class I/II-fold pyridoxal phosphate-dependent enzyme [Acidobacteriaceae bacterium]